MNVWENEHTWYATSENPQYMTEKRYKTCFDMPLLYDAIKRLYSTSITFGGPFVGCDTTTLASFEQMR